MPTIPDHVLTGYEPQFDWLAHQSPPRPYLLATVPRSGSTYFSHLLWRTGCLGAPLEYLNFEATGPFGHVHGRPRDQIELWDRIVRTRTSPNGIFGLKAFPLQMEVLAAANPALLSGAMRFLLAAGPASKVVQLRRRDTEAHAISLARASLSGIWRQEQETGARAEPEFSPAMVERASRELAMQEKAWEQMYGEMGIAPLVVWYEDVLDDPAAAVALVADYLDVTLDPDARVDVPEIRRQSQDGARAWKRQMQG
ncbi:Stf0 family sulfotransferase [Qipengyuania sp. JC766]|uniref:Stf0 family sulfotransferase n=1 Tax=Qipengyuania sp. JC766 TaxID=3232139 RepID=UPI00345815B8